MTPQLLNDGIKTGMAVRSVDGAHLGTAAEVWPDVDFGTGMGAAASAPRPGAETTDPELFTFSDFYNVSIRLCDRGESGAPVGI